MKTRLVRRKLKLTLFPCILPFPVISHRAAIFSYSFTTVLYYCFLWIPSRGSVRVFCGILESMTFDVTYIALVIAVVLLSMTLHEAMHAYASYWLGDDTAKAQGRLTLNPIAHIDPFLTLALPVMLAVLGLPIFGGAKPVPFNPMRVRFDEFGAALVGIAGPLTNLVIAFFAFGIAALSGVNVADGMAGGFMDLVFTLIVLVNLGFFIFNMLPIPPLDGSRLLYALAPDSARRAMEVIERNGLLVVFALVLLFSNQIGQFILGARQVIVDIFAAIFGVY